MKRNPLNNEEERELGSFENMQSAPIVRSTDQMTTRKTFSLPSPLADDLELYAHKSRRSVSKAISRSIETQLYLAGEVEKGGEIIIRTHDGKLQNFEP